jgi:hypothetical protein
VKVHILKPGAHLENLAPTRATLGPKPQEQTPCKSVMPLLAGLFGGEPNALHCFRRGGEAAENPPRHKQLFWRKS